MKNIAYQLAAGIAVFGLAPKSSATDVWEKAINDSLIGLRASTGVIFHLEGHEWVNNASAPIQCDLFYSVRYNGSQPFVQVELTSFLNGKVSDRIVGDGTTLWIYNCRTFEYSATAYGTYSGKVAPNYLRDLLLMVYSKARGAAVYPARLLKETFSGDNVEYRSWMPGAQPVSVVGGQSWKDPIWTTKVYVPAVTEQVWQFTGTPSRSMAFTVTQNNNIWDLTKIEYCQAFKIGSKERFSEWSMNVWSNAGLDAANFKPYDRSQIAGWRALPSAKPGG